MFFYILNHDGIDREDTHAQERVFALVDRVAREYLDMGTSSRQGRGES